MGKKMQVGVTLYSYMQDLSRQKINVDQAIEHAAGCGAKCVEIVDSCHFLEWPHPKLTDIYHVKEKIKSLKMDIACFSQYTENEYSADYKCTEEDKIQQVKESILYAHIMGAPMTRITPYTNVDPLINRVIEKSLPFAEKYNIIITLEIHSPQKPDKFIRTMQQFKSKYLGLVPDFSAWYYQGGLSLDSFKACLPYTRHIHGKAHSIIPFDGNEPSIPYKGLMTILRNAKYGGSIVAEYEPRGDDPQLYDTRKGVESLVRYINSFVS